MNNTLINYFFRTNALRACEDNSPFWLTSGKIGIYYINAEFLFGSKEDADAILNSIDGFLSEQKTLASKIFDILLRHYEINEIFKYTIDCMKKKILETVAHNEIDYISGGERRDWIFSILLSHLIGKPHITIFKNHDMWISDHYFKSTVIAEYKLLKYKNVFHVSDLITEASSYVNQWIPALSNMDASMKWTITVVDEMQGGTEKLSQLGIDCLHLISADRQLFVEAYDRKVITEKQLKLIDEYMYDPYNTIRKFLLTHPEFLSKSLESSGLEKLRAEKCISQNFYNLPYEVCDATYE